MKGGRGGGGVAIAEAEALAQTCCSEAVWQLLLYTKV